MVLSFLTFCKTTQKQIKEIDEIPGTTKYLSFNIYNFNFSNYQLPYEDCKGNYALVYGNTAKWDSVLFYHKRYNKIEKIIYLGNNLFKCSFLNSSEKSQVYIDTIYSNLKDTVIYFRDKYSIYNGNFLGTQYKITVSNNSHFKVIKVIDDELYKRPVKQMLKKIQQKEYRSGQVEEYKSFSNDKCYLIEISSNQSLKADTTVINENNCLENGVWESYWRKYSKIKKGPPG